MIETLERWLNVRRLERRDRRRRAGFEWASAELVRGASIDEVAARVRCTGDYFDVGVIEAITAWMARLRQPGGTTCGTVSN